MADFAHKLDIGTIIRLVIRADGVVQDVSSATVTKQIKLQKPDGVTVTKTAVFTTNGKDGQIQYTTVANDLDQVGRWKAQGYVVLSSGTWHTTVETFEVLPTL
jgi:hypothetical protein